MSNLTRLAFYDGTAWLADPAGFQKAVARVMSAARCFTREEVLAAHRADLERAKLIVQDAIPALANARTAPIELAISGDFADKAARMDAPRPIRAVKGKVGVIPVWGAVQQRQSSELMKCGGTSLDFVSAAFDQLIDDTSIGAIVLAMDSPGGESFGVEELADKIYAARGAKPIYAISDSMACSAAYWIASAASTLICTPGGIVGSVGVYVMHVDQSAADAEAGFVCTLISAGKFKTELSPFGPLSDDAIANQQQYVDDLYDKFCGAVAQNRGTPPADVRANYGQGRVLTADDALAAGMIDRVLTFDDLMGRLTGQTAAGSGGGQASAQATTASMEVLRLRHEQRKRTDLGAKRIE